jgi:hypothetical protein
MSVLKVTTIQDASGGNTATINSMTPTADSLQGFRNRIINGDMRIDQRNAGASVTITTGVSYITDRFFAQGSVTSKFTAQQSSTAPAGFVNSLLLTSSAATTPGASDYYYFSQRIEGLNVADLAWGTASAKTVTLSFWVRSSLTGTFSGALLNSATNRSYAFTYSISVADTWEQKSVTISGDTSGTWLTTNGTGIESRFALGAGSSFLQSANSWSTGNVVGATGTTQLISTNGATLYITGVQLEVGSVATPFERRDYGRELAMCQRYYYRLSLPTDGNRYFIGFNLSTTTAEGIVFFKSSMRTAPTALEQTGTASNYSVLNQTTNVASSSVPTFNAATVDNASVLFTVSSGLTAGNGVVIRSNAANTYLGWSAEL